MPKQETSESLQGLGAMLLAVAHLSKSSKRSLAACFDLDALRQAMAFLTAPSGAPDPRTSYRKVL